jgi:NAD-dependent dihydropyrimidine dehydrogenase PreA subunit
MNRVSKRSLINFVVDAAIAAAFIVSAVSGLVFLVPAGWLSISGASTSALGVEFATWRTVHDWAALIMIAGVVLHTALHWKWVTSMVRRLAGGGRTQARPAASPATGTEWAPAATTPAATTPAVSTPASSAGGRRGLTRSAFLKRAGAVGAAALAGGLIGREAAGAAMSWMGDASTNDTSAAVQDATGPYGSATDGSSGAVTGSSTDGSSTWDEQPAAQSGASTARVTIDAERCTGCGDCLRVCPDGVFAASDGQAVVANADACRLCGHCTEVCRAAAITLNG